MRHRCSLSACILLVGVLSQVVLADDVEPRPLECDELSGTSNDVGYAGSVFAAGDEPDLNDLLDDAQNNAINQAETLCLTEVVCPEPLEPHGNTSFAELSDIGGCKVGTIDDDLALWTRACVEAQICVDSESTEHASMDFPLFALCQAPATAECTQVCCESQ